MTPAKAPTRLRKDIQKPKNGIQRLRMAMEKAGNALTTPIKATQRSKEPVQKLREARQER